VITPDFESSIKLSIKQATAQWHVVYLSWWSQESIHCYIQNVY